MSDDFGNFLDGMYKAPFQKNRWGNWNYRTAEGRDPFQNAGLSNVLSKGSVFELMPNGTVRLSSTPGPSILGAGATPAIQHMASNMLDTTGGYPGQWQPNGFSNYTMSQGGPPPMPGRGIAQTPMGQALRRDMAVTQQAADQQRATNIQQGRQLRDMAGGWSSKMMRDAAGQAGTFAGQANALDRQMGGFKSDIERMMARQTDPKALYSGAMNTLKSGIAEGNRAVSQMNKAVADTDKFAAEDASSAAYAMARSTESQKKAAIGQTAGTYDKNQILEMSRAIDMEGSAQRQQVVTQIRSDYQRRKSELQSQAAQMTAANAAYKAQASGQMAGLNQQLRGFEQDNIQNKMALQSAMNAAGELAKSYRQASYDIYNAGVLRAAELEMSGQTAYAQTLRDNPYSVVSWVQGLLSLEGMNAARTMA